MASAAIDPISDPSVRQARLRETVRSLVDAVALASVLALSLFAVLALALIAPLAVIVSSIAAPLGGTERRGGWKAAPAH